MKSKSKLTASILESEEMQIFPKNGMPQRIRHWQIEKKLGRGATATVFLGRSLIDNSLVAIKQFSADLFQNNQNCAAYRKMMMNEANLAGKLVHPFILQTYSVGLEAEQKYLVMEYVKTGNLEEATSKPNKLLLSEILRMFFQCACALQYSDEIGIIHRDIKPANVLLQTNKLPKISDFGSSMKKGDDKNSISGVGSPAYMSPEQIRELPLNQQTDIYSFGASLFEIISGNKPFSASTQYETIYKILHDDAPSLSVFIKSNFPPLLDEILQKSMKKRQEERYQNWADLLFDFNKILQIIFPTEKKYGLIDEIKSFDWLRGCPSLKMFHDNELWDLIQNGVVFKMGVSSRAKVVFKEQEEKKIADINAWDFDKKDESKKTVTSHSFILAGAMQIYEKDNKISILTAGDYIADMTYLPDPQDERVDSYSIDETMVLTIEDAKINDIHPVVQGKLHTLINISTESQLAIKRKRHDQNQKVYTEEDIINTKGEISINPNAHIAKPTQDGEDFFDANHEDEL